jgi:hypothetical protein
MGDIMKLSMIACVSVLALAGCTDPATPKPESEVDAIPGFRGAVLSHGTMVASPNRCAFSFLFADVTKQRAPAPIPKPQLPRDPPAPENEAAAKNDPAKLGPDAPSTWRFILSAPDKMAGASFHVSVRGAYAGTAVGPVGTVKIEAGGAAETKELATVASTDGADFPDGGEIYVELKGKVATGDNLMVLTLQLPQPAKPDDQQMLWIDSIDVASDGASCPTYEDAQSQVPERPAFKPAAATPAQ